MDSPAAKAALRLTATLSLFLAVLAAGCTTPQPATPTPSDHSHEADTVKLVNMAFEPAELAVKVGSTVRWINQDSYPHDVTAKGEAWQSEGGPGGLPQGADFSKTFDAPGVYEYYCMLHGMTMSGKIVVQ